MPNYTWDWIKFIPSGDYYKLCLNGWPGWDKDHDNEPYHVNLSIKMGKNKSSRDMAVEFDDLATGNFWYRDYTKSGIPIVDEGEVYQSIFVFQFKSDYDKFVEKYKK